MDILSDSDPGIFVSETLSTSRTSTRGDENKYESSIATEGWSSEGEESTQRDSYSGECVTSPHSAKSSSLQTSLNARGTSIEDSMEEGNPAREFMRRCCQAVQRNYQGERVEAETKSTCSDAERFCTNSVKRLQSGRKMSHLDSAATADIPRVPNPSVPIYPDVLERLKMERLLHSMREVTQVPEDNELRDCSTCRNVKRDVDERAFIKDNVRKLRNRLTEEKLQRHLVEMDSVNCIGELAAGLPRASDPPEVIWEKLMKR